jgi:hypothetical protein
MPKSPRMTMTHSPTTNAHQILHVLVYNANSTEESRTQWRAAESKLGDENKTRRRQQLADFARNKENHLVGHEGACL